MKHWEDPKGSRLRPKFPIDAQMLVAHDPRSKQSFLPSSLPHKVDSSGILVSVSKRAALASLVLRLLRCAFVHELRTGCVNPKARLSESLKPS